MVQFSNCKTGFAQLCQRKASDFQPFGLETSLSQPLQWERCERLRSDADQPASFQSLSEKPWSKRNSVNCLPSPCRIRVVKPASFSLFNEKPSVVVRALKPPSFSSWNEKSASCNIAKEKPSNRNSLTVKPAFFSSFGVKPRSMISRAVQPTSLSCWQL